MTRQLKLIAGLLLVLVLAVVTCYRHLARQRDLAERSRDDLVTCRRLAGQIRRARNRPRVAAEAATRPSATTAQIEAAATTAGLPSDRLVRIFPEPARRLGDTVYKEKPTQVILRNVTLEQLVALAHGLIDGDQPLHSKSIRISAPSAQDTFDNWHAELVFTYLIYEPPVTAPGSRP